MLNINQIAPSSQLQLPSLVICIIRELLEMDQEAQTMVLCALSGVQGEFNHLCLGLFITNVP